MRSNKVRYLVPVLMSLLITCPGYGQEDMIELLTMEDAISRALSLNNQVKASGYSLERATWDKRRAWTMLFPTLTLNSRYTWIDDSTFALRDFFRQNIRTFFPNIPAGVEIPQTVFQESYYHSLDLSMPLFNGALLNGLSIASANEDMFDKQHHYTIDNTIFKVISNYLAVLKSREILSLQKEYLTLSLLNWQKAERMYSAGRWSKTDALRWKIEHQQQKSNVVAGESGVITAVSVLSTALNLKMTQELEVVEKLPQRLTEEIKKMESMSNDSIYKMIRLDDAELINANAALKALEYGTEISKLQYRNSYTPFLPNVSLDYSYAWRENNTIAFDDYSPQTLMINLSLPLFSSFQDYTALESNYYAYKKTEADLHDQLNNTRLVLTETTNKIVNLKTQMELSKLNVEFNELNYQTIEKQKEKGLVSNIDFIDAKINLQNARIEDISNRYDFISAVVELYYLLGMMESIVE